MEFALAQYTSIEVRDEASFITLYSDSLGTFFEKKNYGSDIKDITINIICVSEKFAPFFKPKKPKYVKDKKNIESYGFQYEIEKRLIYEVKIDFNEFKNAESEIQRKQILAREILSSLDTLDSMKKKIKDFDWETFKNDLETYFKEKGLL